MKTSGAHVSGEKDGAEVPLANCQAASNSKRIFDQVIAVMEEGVGARAVSHSKSKRSLSKSETSRMWIKRSREQLAEFRSRKLDHNNRVAIFLDGVRLTDETWVVVAVGVDHEGRKQALNFEEGPSENTKVYKELLAPLKSRGIGGKAGRRLLFCRDGSRALARNQRALAQGGAAGMCGALPARVSKKSAPS